MISNVTQAAEIIKAGGLVAFPTETVYGLGADATDEVAVAKIFQIKKRPGINPLIIHVASIEQAESIGAFNEDAYILSKLWPGPLSIVMPVRKGAGIAKSALAGLSTVAIRIPAHKAALELIRQSGTSLSAPSANPSGYISATEYEHVFEHFSKDGVFILKDNAKCKYGLESTIVNLTGEMPTILRYGFITPELLSSTLGKPIAITAPLPQIKAPGMLDKHYSPHLPVRLNADSLGAFEVGLNFGRSKLCGCFSLNLSEQGDLIEAASNLYSSLRKLDNYAVLNKIEGIAIAPIPAIGIGIAINDRLKRAAY
jgi:L-threonylcarbamoyladenylate synthase